MLTCDFLSLHLIDIKMAQVDSWNAGMNTPLQQEDPEIYDLIQKEKYRQYSGLELIASEVSCRTTTVLQRK